MRVKCAKYACQKCELIRDKNAKLRVKYAKLGHGGKLHFIACRWLRVKYAKIGCGDQLCFIVLLNMRNHMSNMRNLVTRINYGVVTVSRINKIIGLFCKILSLL